MSRAEELALQSENLADARLESDGYEWSVDADVQLRLNAAELRRLSAVEAELEALKKAISEAEPVAWMPPERDGEYHAFDTETVYRTPKAGWEPLYTLKGIK